MVNNKIQALQESILGRYLAPQMLVLCVWIQEPNLVISMLVWCQAINRYTDDHTYIFIDDYICLFKGESEDLSSMNIAMVEYIYPKEYTMEISNTK